MRSRKGRPRGKYSGSSPHTISSMGAFIMQKNKRRIKLGRRFLSALDLPEEAAGTPKVTLLGRDWALVENHKGLYQYREQEICLYTREGMLVVSGKGLTLKELSPERMFICGTLVGSPPLMVTFKPGTIPCNA